MENDPTPEPDVEPVDELGAVASAESDVVGEPAERGRRRMSNRTATLVLAGVLLVAFVAWAATRPVPYVSLGPGPTFNTLGSYDGKPLITVTGAKTYPTSGNLDLTTVSESGGPYSRIGLGEALAGWIDPDVAVVPERLLYPKDTSPKEVEEQNQADFSDAESSATYAAFSYLGIPVTRVVKVSEVRKGAPADGKLEAGDVVVAIDGTPLKSIEQGQKLIRATKAGETVAVTVRRDGKEKVVVVKPAARTENGKTTPAVGITLQDSFEGPVKVTYSLTGVGGPSAGLMFSLGLVDKLTPGSLNGGAHVAGTGTIDPDGTVGRIGGIQQKMAGARGDGATVFLVPDGNCQEAAGAVPKGLRIVKVTTLTSAVDALKAIKAGKPTPTCS